MKTRNTPTLLVAIVTGFLSLNQAEDIFPLGSSPVPDARIAEST